MPVMMRIQFLNSQYRPKYFIIAEIIVLLYGIWNLDFIRLLNLGICLETSTQFNLTLDLLVAVYPLLLMILTYLHDTLV